MPVNWVKDDPKKEKAWKRAKDIFKDQTKKKEDNWGPEEWAQVMSIAKSIVKSKKENTLKKSIKEIAENIQIGDVVSVLGYDNYGDRSWDTASYGVVKSIPRRGECTVRYLDSEAEVVTVSSSEIELADERIAAQYRRNNKFKYIFEKRKRNNIMKDKIIEIKEDIRIGEIILGKGDKIRILKERLHPDVVKAAKDLIEAVYNTFPDEDPYGGVEAAEIGGVCAQALVQKFAALFGDIEIREFIEGLEGGAYYR